MSGAVVRLQPRSSKAARIPLAVVIVTYNSAEVLGGLLDSLVTGLADVPDAIVIVADNDSSDTSIDIAEHHPIGARVLRTGRNGGYAAGINAAAATVEPDVAILVLNPDIRLEPGTARRLLARAAEPDVGVVVPQMRNVDGTIALSLRREPSLQLMWAQALLGPSRAAHLGMGEMIAEPAAYREAREVDWATGAALLVTPRARACAGRWDESFFLYSEEVDYQRRVRACGFRVVYEPEARVTHIGGDYMQSPTLAALMTSNQIRYFGRHHGRLETVLFRWAIIAFGLLRAWKSRAHRAVLRAGMTPDGQ